MNSNSPNTFVPGDWNAVCDVCGHKYKASSLRKRWDGAMCCQTDWEPRQPQDFVRAVPDNMSTPWSRPGSDPVYAATPSPIETEDTLLLPLLTETQIFLLTEN